MLHKTIIVLFVFLNIIHISNAFKVQLPTIERNDNFIPLKTDSPLEILKINAQNPHKNLSKNVLLITPENWNHFNQLFIDYQLDQENWLSPFIDSNCTEIIIYTTMLDINRMKLTPAHITFLSRLLPNLISLSLREYCAQNTLIMAIAQINTLEEIDLYQNHATKEGIKALALLPHLTKLNLGFNDIHDSADSWEDLQKKYNTIEAYQKELGSLNENQTALTPNQLERRNFILKELKYAEQSAIEALSTNTSLQKLNLTGTNLTKNDLKIIATMSHLKKLNLTANYLQNTGATIIATMHTLENLNVTGNKIANTGVEALSHMNQLKKLNISRNQFSNKGEENLAHMQSLLTLSVTENDFVTNNFENVRKIENLKLIGAD